jgi:hypothetical protein
MGLPASEPESSRPAGSTFENKGGRALMASTGGNNKAFSFVSGNSALIAPILEGLWSFDKVDAKSLKTTPRLTIQRTFLGPYPTYALLC